MGNARFSDTDWKAHAQKTSTKSRAQIFTQSSMHAELDPAKIKYRESRNSPANPRSRPVILAVDVTGSMGYLAENIIRRGLGIIMTALYDRKPVTDPHIMCMAVGDANCDQAPLQVTQFEASVEPMVKQVGDIWLEGNGGGNNGESYGLPWLFTMAKTKCDAIKQGRRGYLFTIGDEAPHMTIDKAHAKRFLNIDCEADIDVGLLLKDLSKDWNVFHLIVETSATREQGAVERWRELLNERAIVVTDHEKLAEGIVATIQLCEGVKVPDVRSGWDADSAIVVDAVVKQLTRV